MPDGFEDPDVWVTKNKNKLKWKEVSETHLKSIIKSIKDGRECYLQEFKLDRAEKELSKRKF